MIFQHAYFLIGLVLAIASALTFRAGSIRTRNDGLWFSTMILVFLFWPLCIISFLVSYLLDRWREGRS